MSIALTSLALVFTSIVLILAFGNEVFDNSNYHNKTVMNEYRTGSPTAVQAWQPCPLWELITPYYCRLGDLLCVMFLSAYCIFLLIVYLMYFFSKFDTVGWVFWPVKTVAHITYNVLVETLNHAQSINQYIIVWWWSKVCVAVFAVIYF